mgnify:FL=1
MALRLILLLLIAPVLLGQPAARANPAPKPVPVIAHEVADKAFSDRVEALGTLRANESVVLTASVTETVSAPEK